MTPEKRKKIKALLADPATSENEKEICRTLLKDNPEEDPRQERWDRLRETLNSGRVTFEPPAPRSQQSGDFWRQNLNAQQQAAAAQQQAADQGQDRAAAAQQQAAAEQAGGLFGQTLGGSFEGGLGGLFGALFGDQGQQAAAQQRAAGFGFNPPPFHRAQKKKKKPPKQIEDKK